MSELVEKNKAELINILKDPIIQQRVSGHPKADDIKKLIKDEVNRMCETEGLHGKMVIEEFVEAFHKSEGRTGSDNRVNSWTAWAIGMTHKQPDGEFLPKRRAFARAGFPDIDTDFDYERRQEVYDYIIDKYGRANVGNIGTYGGLKMKSFIRRAFKALDPDRVWQNTKQAKEQWKTETNQKADEIIKSLPPQYGAILKVKGEDGEEHAIKTLEDAHKYCRDFKYYIDKYPDLLEHSRSLEGLLSIYSVHAAGVVISDCPLADIAPLRQTSIRKSAGDGENVEKVYEYATQFEYNDLESMGLIKFDILALSTLTVISQCVNLIRENYEHLSDFDIENIPLDDQSVFELYRTGNLAGVFQVEEPGMQKAMKQIGVDCFDDIVAGVALYRPGPMEYIPQYCARKRGNEPISYFHQSIAPYVKEYLEPTYGLIVYQEQLMQVCNSLAGFSITDGYVMIKAIGKKKKDLLDKFERDFVDGCEKNKVEKSIAKNYWDKVIVPFADYAFNKSLLENTLIPTPNGVKELKEFKAGDEVYCINENGDCVLTEVLALHDHGVLDGYKIIFDDESEVICSADHKFLTEKGQQPLWLIWRNRLSIFGTHFVKGEFNAKSQKMGSQMWSDFVNQEVAKSPSIDLQDLPISGLEKEAIGRSSSTPVEMWSYASNASRHATTPNDMLQMSICQEKQYTEADGEAKRGQLLPSEKGYFLRNCEENICSSGDTGSSIGTIKTMARGKSGEASSMYSCCAAQPEAVKDGSMASRSDWLEIAKNSMWRRSKASRFCERGYLDRSRWLLPFFRTSEIEEEKNSEKLRSSSRTRCDAEFGSDHQESNADKNRDGLLQEFERINEGRMVGDRKFYAPVSETRHLVSRKIVRVVPVGKQRMFDLEVACPTHNFLLDNGVVTSNSHSVCYGFISYQTAYLKAHFPEEFICSYLNVELNRAKYEKIQVLENACENQMGIKLLPRNVNKCGIKYEIISKKDSSSGISQSQIRPPIQCKGLSRAAAENIAENAPYKDMRDLAFKTDPSSVDTKSIESLAIAGFFKDKDENGKRIPVEHHVKQFSGLRDDIKRSRRKGIMSQDIFG